MDPHALAVFVRLLHIAAMTVAAGGAALLTLLALSRTSSLGGTALLGVAVVYERAFWVAAGVLVMTGVGNLAAFGAQLPARDTAWGTALLVKLALVVALMLVSVPRTLALVQFAARSDDVVAARPLLARLYVGTLGGFAVIVAIAVWLSHG